jgi:acylphosphatase
MSNPTKAFTAIVSGYVQGVGFRYYTRSMANRLGVRGYVQNLPDGTVKVVCEGNPAAASQMEKWLRQGPPSARVTHVEVTHHSAASGYPAFTVEF